MNPCDENRQRVFLYLDDELRDADLVAFESHLKACAACRQAIENARRFVEDVRSARPLHTAPADLRSRVERILQDAPQYTAPHHLRTRVREIIESTVATRPRFRWRLVHAIPALATLAAIFTVVRLYHPRSELTDTAIQAHTQIVRGVLPLEVHSSSPEVLSAWFTQRVPFHLKLPPYREMPELVQPLELTGGRLVAFRNSRAAYVAYQVRNKPVGLIAVSASAAKPSGGKKVVMGPLTFYYDTVDGYNVITWSSKTKLVTYAMVSDRSERPQQSCIVCHAGPEANDRDLMRGLLTQ